MCGIAGWLGQKIDTDCSSEILRRLAHRGPDGKGEWASGGVWFGHRRLAVLDLTSDGRQPMISASGRYVLTYNGEVYNYQELRGELEQAGERFRGHSDTEVVLAACEYWGIELAVARFEGMFAFSLYDTLERVLWLARDRFIMLLVGMSSLLPPSCRRYSLCLGWTIQLIQLRCMPISVTCACQLLPPSCAG